MNIMFKLGPNIHFFLVRRPADCPGPENGSFKLRLARKSPRDIPANILRLATSLASCQCSVDLSQCATSGTRSGMTSCRNPCHNSSGPAGLLSRVGWALWPGPPGPAMTVTGGHGRGPAGPPDTIKAEAAQLRPGAGCNRGKENLEPPGSRSTRQRSRSRSP